MIKVEYTSRYRFVSRCTSEIEEICNNPDVYRVINVSISENDAGFMGFVTYEKIEKDHKIG